MALGTDAVTMDEIEAEIEAVRQARVPRFRPGDQPGCLPNRHRLRVIRWLGLRRRVTTGARHPSLGPLRCELPKVGRGYVPDRR